MTFGRGAAERKHSEMDFVNFVFRQPIHANNRKKISRDVVHWR